MLKTASLAPKVAEVLKAEFKDVGDLAKYNADYEAKHKDIRHILSSVVAQRIIDGKDTSSKLTAALSQPGTTFTEAIEVLEYLRSAKSGEAEAFQKAAQAKFPEATRLA